MCSPGGVHSRTAGRLPSIATVYMLCDLRLLVEVYCAEAGGRGGGGGLAVLWVRLECLPLCSHGRPLPCQRWQVQAFLHVKWTPRSGFGKRAPGPGPGTCALRKVFENGLFQMK